MIVRVPARQVEAGDRWGSELPGSLVIAVAHYDTHPIICGEAAEGPWVEITVPFGAGSMSTTFRPDDPLWLVQHPVYR